MVDAVSGATVRDAPAPSSTEEAIITGAVCPSIASPATTVAEAPSGTRSAPGMRPPWSEVICFTSMPFSFIST